MHIRELRADETELLKDFLYEAIFIPEGVESPDKSICISRSFLCIMKILAAVLRIIVS